MSTDLSQFAESLVAKLKQSGCWADYNDNYRYYTFLIELAQSGALGPNVTIQEPQPQNFNQTNCT